jgi:predicted anti-sigma-YlaC factor YlaD
MSKLIKTDCNYIQDLLLNNEIDVLSSSEQFQLRSHLEKCDACRIYQANIKQI